MADGQGRAAAIATSDPRATAVGADVLRAGGNCVDAAVAAALALFVLEPHHCGPGGDAFLLAQLPEHTSPVALDGAGDVPKGIEGAALTAVPAFGPLSVTVPGAPGLLEAALSEFGNCTMGQLVGPALAFAADGFAVRPSLAAAVTQSAARLRHDAVLGPLYAPGGVPVATGERLVNPALAGLLEELATSSTEVLYRGRIAYEIASVVIERGGCLSTQDLAGHTTTATEPESVSFAGATVWQLPAPTQGPAVLLALRELADVDPDAGWLPVASAIQAGLAAVGVDLVGAPWRRTHGGTTHIAVADSAGGAASLITSIFAPFGAGIGVPVLGGPLQNRAAGFLLIDQPPVPGKPPHTIIPGLVTRDGSAETALGVAGGLMQAQGQVQLLVRMLRRGESPAEAVAAPRLRVIEGGAVAAEPGHPLLAQDPDAVGRKPGDGGFGCAQVASRARGLTVAAGDTRRGGDAEVVQIDQGRGARA